MTVSTGFGTRKELCSRVLAASLAADRVAKVLQPADDTLSRAAFWVRVAMLHRLTEHMPPREYRATIAALDELY